MFAERVDIVAAYLFAYRLEDSRVGNHHRGHLTMHDLLRLQVERGALALIRFGTRLGDQLFKRLIAPLRGVGTALG